MSHDESLAPLNDIDAVCDRFARDWQPSMIPRIEDVLEQHSDLDRSHLLRELLMVEIEVRRQRGETVTAADFIHRFPESMNIIEEALSTIRYDSAALAETVDVSLSPTDETYVSVDSEVEATFIPGSTTQPESAPSTDVSGKRFGDYELLHEIARGGMGVVYKARQTKLNRIVALKMIRSGELAGQDEVQRFHTEAEAAAQLDHPNIVPIYEVGELDGQHFFSMGLIKGGSLSDLVREKPVPPRRAAELIQSIANSIQYAHARNVVHRDLKPANILLDNDGQPKVTDFGLAKLVERDSGLTTTGQIVGTPSYMPPEQAAGKTSTVGPLADVYALGAILYFLLTGRPPFRGANVMETLKQVLEQEPTSPRQHIPALDRDLETICLKCLQKNPEKRYASAAELANELGRYLRREPIMARPVGSFERLGMWWGRNPLLGTLSTALAVLLMATVISAIITAVYFSELADSREKALNSREEALQGERQARLDEQKALVAETKARNRAERALGLSTLAEAQIAWDKGDAKGARERHRRVAEHARFWDWRYLQQRFADPPFTASDHKEAVSHVAWSPDGKVLVSGSNDGVVLLRDANDKKILTTITAHPGPLVGLCFSPSGNYLATAGADGAVRVWTISDGKLHRESVLKPFSISAIAWAPADPFLAIGESNGGLRLWDGIAGKPVRTLPGATQQITALAFNPSHRQLARASRDGTVCLVDYESNKIVRVISTKNQLGALAFSPDGTRLAGGDDENISLWDPETGETIRKLPIYPNGVAVGYRHLVTSLSFRGDGERLASCCGGYGITTYGGPGPDLTVRVWSVSDGRLVASFKGPTGFVSSVCYSPDGQRIAAGSVHEGGNRRPGELRIWDARGDGEYRPFSDCQLRVESLVFSPDGTRLATVGGTDAAADGDGGELKIFNATDGKVAVRRRYPRVLKSVSFHPNGKSLATGSEGTIELWDADSGKHLQSLAGGHTGEVGCVAHARDGRRLVSGDADGNVCLWDLASGRMIARTTRKIKSAEYSIAAFLPKGDGVVFGARQENSREQSDLLVWSYKGKTKPVTRIRLMNGLVGFAIHPDGSEIAVLTADGSVNLIGLADWKSRLQFPSLQRAPTAVAYSPDGQRLATMANDRTVRLWDTETGRAAMVLTAPQFPSDALAFSPDGRRLAAGGGGPVNAPFWGDVHVWDATPAVDNPPYPGAMPDPAWHASHNKNFTYRKMTPHGYAFHARFALQSNDISILFLTSLLESQELLVDEQRKNGSLQLASAVTQLRQTAEMLASRGEQSLETRAILARVMIEPRWLAVLPNQAVSQGQATLTIQRHAFVQASGKNPPRDVYTLSYPAGLTDVTAVRLEMFPDAAHNHSLGRASNGNFDLSEIELFVIPGGKRPGTKVKWRSARGSYAATAATHYSKKHVLADRAIDGDIATTWNTWPKLRQRQWLIAETKDGAVHNGEEYEIKLRFESGGEQHALARFRLTLTTDTKIQLRERLATELPKRKVSNWTILAAAALLRGDTEGVRAAWKRAIALPTGETALDAVFLALALNESEEQKEFEATIMRARQLAKKNSDESLLRELLQLARK